MPNPAYTTSHTGRRILSPHSTIHGEHLLYLLGLLPAYLVCSVPVAPSKVQNYQLTSVGYKTPLEAPSSLASFLHPTTIFLLRILSLKTSTNTSRT